MTQLITALGLMSGTSCDGIDVSIIQSDGEQKINFLSDFFHPYSTDIKVKMRNLKDKINNFNDLKKNKNEIIIIEKIITKLHLDSIELILKKKNIKKKEIDIIGFHGQTIYHNYKEKISKQIGDAKILSNSLGKNIVYNFRENDIKNGGQGAPLTPIYHKLIYNFLKLNDPAVFVNIGGISNLTFIDEQKKILSFDSGPGNFLIDKFLQIHSNNKIQFDKDGIYAFKGIANEIILESLLNDPYFDLLPPKSLDVNDFNLSSIRGLSVEDAVSTLSELTIRSIFNSIVLSKKKVNQIILCGGGRKNKYFSSRLKELSNLFFLNIDDYNINGDFIESQAFAYLAIRSILKKPLTYPSTTGVSKDCLGGTILKVK